MVTVYKVRPSQLMEIEDAYTAYCFDEACELILINLENGEEIVKKRDYASFSDMYKQYE